MEQEMKMQEVSERVAIPDPRVRDRAGDATVVGFKPDTEQCVVDQQRWAAVHARRGTGAALSVIAREFELDRKTVRALLAQKVWQPYRRLVKRPRKLDAHLAWLEERAGQVNYSARILYQELSSQRGFAGCYETVKVAVRPMRAAASVAALTQRRFESAPGEQAQVDWGQVSVHIGQARVKVHILVMTLGFSRRGWAEGFLNERMANVLGGHESAFAHFGGRCETILYDRMRTVAAPLEGQLGRLNPTFEAFARHWGFTPRLCQPYRAQTKGKVESGVKYIKRNFVPGRQFASLEDFNAQLVTWQAEVADMRIHGTTHQRPIDRFAGEALALAPVAGHASFLAAMVRERVVAEDWLVSIDGNRYSVPFGLIGKTVQVVREGALWMIRHRGQVVAEHVVLAGKAQLSVRGEHGPGAAARNARTRYARRVVNEVAAPTLLDLRQVQVRDLAVYEQLLEAA